MRLNDVPIADVLRDYCNIDLGGRETGRVGIKCPFHSGKNAESLSIYLDTNSAYCFGGCGFLDSVRIVAKQLGISHHEAREDLMKHYGIEALTPEEEQAIRKHELLERYVEACHESLTDEARQALHQRGITEETIERERLGLDVGQALSGEERREAGIGDFFVNCIILPGTKNGKLIYAVAWNWRGEVDQPKYAALSGWGRPVIGTPAPDGSVIVVTEGIFDYLSLTQAGIPALCTLGVEITVSQGKELAKMKNLVILFDNDTEGRTAARKLAADLFPAAKMARVPGIDGQFVKDPNELLQIVGHDRFKQLIDAALSEAVDPLDVLIADIERTENLNHVIFLKDEALKLIAKVESGTSRDIYLQKVLPVLKKHGVTKRTLQADLTKVSKDVSSSGTEPGENGDQDQHEVPTAILPGLVDIVVDDEGNPAFLMLEDGELAVTPAIPGEECVFVPPDKDKTPWLLAKAEEVIKHYKEDTDAAVYDALLEYYRAISELPTDKHYDLLATWTMHTYLMEKNQYSPYLWFYAVYERGKTRTGKALIYAAYRGVHVESLRDAYIVRVANDWQATLFFDVINLWQKAEKVGSEDVLMSRYERGIKVPRVNYPDRGKHRDVVYYDIFGGTVAATNVQVGDGLNTRAIQINMPDSTKNFNNEVKPELALPLKERLTAFRARHLNDELPAMAKPPFRRLGDITRPLLQVVRLVRPEREPILLALIEEIENEKRAAMSSTLEARIIEILLSLDEEKLTWYENKECFLLTDLEEALNDGVPDKQKVSSKYLGGKLRALGVPFVHRQPVTKRRLYLYDRDLLNRLAEHYGLTDLPAKKCACEGMGTPSENLSQRSRQSQTVGAVGVQGGTIEDENGTIDPMVPEPSGTIDQTISNGPANGPAGSPRGSKAGDHRDHRDRNSEGVYRDPSRTLSAVEQGEGWEGMLCDLDLSE